jgi:hypothetical protein
MTEIFFITSILCFLLGLSAGITLHIHRSNIGEIMPLTRKGEKLKKELQKEYGAKKGEQILYAMENEGKIKVKENMYKKAEKKMTKKATKKTTKKTSKKK